MNERIKELAEQATYQVYDSRTGLADKFDIEKFAELIVRDCQSRVEQYIYHRGGVTSMPDTVLIKHFGVEE